MDGESGRESPKPASGGLQAPACVHVYVWVFMVTFSVSPTLCLLLVHDGIERGNGLESLVIIGLIQAALWRTQRRCSSEDLSYWDGLLVAAASMTTGENLISLCRAFCLLLAVVIVSVLFAVDHDESRAGRHAGLRFGKLIIWLHKQRLRSDGHS
jgi:hypothetical protein